MNYYEILEVSDKATSADIEKQYNKLIKSSLDGSNKVDIALVKAAYETLRCKNIRKFYNIYGEWGLKHIQTPQDAYTHTKLFTGTGFITLSILATLIIQGVLLFPLALICVKYGFLLTKLTYYYIIFFVTLPLSGFYAFHSFRALKRRAEYDNKPVKRYIFNMSIVLALAFMQMIMFTLTYDKIINLHFTLLPLPYIAAEFIYIRLKRRMTIETVGRRNREYKAVFIFGGLSVRILSMIMMITEIPPKIKIVSFFCIVTEFAFATFTRLKKHVLVYSLALLYGLGLYEGLTESSSNVRMLSLSLFYLISLIISYTILKEWERRMPKNKIKAMAADAKITCQTQLQTKT